MFVPPKWLFRHVSTAHLVRLWILFKRCSCSGWETTPIEWVLLFASYEMYWKSSPVFSSRSVQGLACLCLQCSKHSCYVGFHASYRKKTKHVLELYSEVPCSEGGESWGRIGDKKNLKTICFKKYNQSTNDGVVLCCWFVSPNREAPIRDLQETRMHSSYMSLKIKSLKKQRIHMDSPSISGVYHWASDLQISFQRVNNSYCTGQKGQPISRHERVVPPELLLSAWGIPQVPA